MQMDVKRRSTDHVSARSPTAPAPLGGWWRFCSSHTPHRQWPSPPGSSCVGQRQKKFVNQSWQWQEKLPKIVKADY